MIWCRVAAWLDDGGGLFTASLSLFKLLFHRNYVCCNVTIMFYECDQNRLNLNSPIFSFLLKLFKRFVTHRSFFIRFWLSLIYIWFISLFVAEISCAFICLIYTFSPIIEYCILKSNCAHFKKCNSWEGLHG